MAGERQSHASPSTTRQEKRHGKKQENGRRNDDACFIYGHQADPGVLAFTAAREYCGHNVSDAR
jgi:hypothetical protein